jgi:hypothetical protein
MAHLPIGYLKIIEGDARDQKNYRGLHCHHAITSPPYANSALSRGDPEKRRLVMIAAGHDPKDFLGGNARSATLKHYGDTNRLSEQNIARLRGDEYWEEVETVYTRVFEALQRTGRFIVVIKPVQKKGEVVDLPLKTLQILEKIGFELECVEKFYIKILNTWRNLAYKKTGIRANQARMGDRLSEARVTKWREEGQLRQGRPSPMSEQGQDLVFKALEELGGKATSRQIAEHITQKYPGNRTCMTWVYKPLRALKSSCRVKRTPDGTYEIGSAKSVVLNWER